MDFVVGLPRDAQDRTEILGFVDRFSKMLHYVPGAATHAAQSALIFLESPWFADLNHLRSRFPLQSRILDRVVKLVGTRLKMSTASHPQPDGQTERANRVIEGVLRSFTASFKSWSSFMPMVELALNQAVHASTGLTPFYVNYSRHPQVPALLGMERSMS
ncbi:hypothetical protein PR003_g25474 [Phytophthora rubi]|uniref:Integrase catalytic domain-containing protein n=1 Tax=Phytophthora rubi TaxID=129364 RepID=A0A6A3JHN7_9STRA|nr:hypothetical protein PF003_g36081 [Phytophthora fragariae]KAE8991564.1 hypothetical protein PR001_g21193 [Phytophthora rubi]KAE9289743.1 hypothetical protein PR003_g25474 [Phytophthora rubi]